MPIRIWSAQPDGYYSLASNEGKNNALLMADIMMNNYGFTIQAAAGAIANSMHEGVLNPWQWQDSRFDMSLGCGLFGFTSAQRLANEFPEVWAKMNKSTTEITPGATPAVGANQVSLMASGDWGWIVNGWRTYWNPSEYPDQYSLWIEARDRWGTSSGVTLEQYKRITDEYQACMVFLCCFEGPGEPNYSARVADVDAVMRLLRDEPIPGKFPFLYMAGRDVLRRLMRL